jgi:outer membrane lipoprotein-sorting protein
MSSKHYRMNDTAFVEGADVAGRSLSAQLSLTICAVALFGFAATPCRAQSTAEIFSRMDKAAQSFTGATAGIRVTTHTAIIDEDETQIGTVAVRRYSPNEMQFLINFTGQDAQAIALRGQTLQIYYPKLNTVREYDIGKYKDLAQKLILLGFGMPGRELAANYNVSNLGDEPVQSQDSVHLQLIPKAPDVLKQLSRVDLWISLKTNCPVQQKFYMPGGDYRLATYSDVKVNPPLPASSLDLPKAAKRERMN